MISCHNIWGSKNRGWIIFYKKYFINKLYNLGWSAKKLKLKLYKKSIT